MLYIPSVEVVSSWVPVIVINISHCCGEACRLWLYFLGLQLGPGSQRRQLCRIVQRNYTACKNGMISCKVIGIIGIVPKMKL